MMEKHRIGIIAVALFIGAFALRLMYFLHVKDLPMYYQPILDTGFFSGWADTIRQHPWTQVTTSFREPLYAYFLAVIYAGLRESLNLARVVQCLLGGLTTLIVYWIGRRLYGLWAGVAAGIVFALCIPVVFFASELNEITLTLFLLTASAYAFLRAYDDRPYLNSLVSGLLAGTAFVGNIAAAAALPAWLAGGLAGGSGRVKKALPLMLVGFIIVPLAYQIGLVRSGERTVFPLGASWQAFLGSGSTGGTISEPWYEISVAGRDGAYPAIASSYHIEGQRDAVRFAAIEDSTITIPLQAHTHWQRRVLGDLTGDPLRSLKIYAIKLGTFWGTSQPPLNLDLRFLARYSWLLRTRIFSFGVIAALGLMGLVSGMRRKALHMVVFLPLVSLLAALFLISDGAKVMVIPFLTVFAGYLVSRLIGALRRGERARAGLLIAGTVAVGLVLTVLPAADIDMVASLVTTGDAYGKVLMFDKAEEYYREAMAEDPDRPEPYVSLAKLYGNTGKAQAGVEVLTSAGARGLSDPRIGIERASLLIIAGRYDEAIQELDRVRKGHPYEVRLHQLMGVSLLESGHPEPALGQLRKEVEYGGGGFITYSALGRAKFELGRYEEAAADLESAMFLNPNSAPTSVLLADTYSKLGQHLRACEVLGNILRYDPGNMPLRFKLANCLFRAERPGDALVHLKELYKYDPGNADILVNMGTVYAGMDSLDKAIETWKRALVLDPDNEMAKENLSLAEEENE